MRELKKTPQPGILRYYGVYYPYLELHILYENHGEDPLTLQVKQFNFPKCVTWGRYCVDSKLTKRWAGQSAVRYPARAREFLISKIF